MMNRRGFLARLIAAPVVALAVLRAPIKPVEWLPAPPVVAEPLGISIRFIQSFDMQAAQRVNRLDVVYGVGDLTPEFAVRSIAYPWWSPRRWMAA